jgi:apolipoprotein D and lipocalin family protein
MALTLFAAPFRRTVLRSAVVLSILCLSACAGLSDGPPIPLAKVDMDRMYGGWYLIATIPNWMEKGLVEPYDVYSKRPDGDIQEDFSAREGGFDAPVSHYTIHDWVRPGTDNAHWRVQLLWPLNFPFLVLYHDADYQTVLFGEQNRELGWIFARTQTLSDADYQALLERFRGLGYDPSKFVKFVQKPDQLHQPGFWSDGIK